MKRMGKVTVSVYSKKPLSEDDYNKIEKSFSESIKPEEILAKKFSTFNRLEFNKVLNRVCLYFDEVNEYSYESYVKVLRVEELQR